VASSSTGMDLGHVGVRPDLRAGVRQAVAVAPRAEVPGKSGLGPTPYLGADDAETGAKDEPGAPPGQPMISERTYEGGHGYTGSRPGMRLRRSPSRDVPPGTAGWAGAERRLDSRARPRQRSRPAGEPTGDGKPRLLRTIKAACGSGRGRGGFLVDDANLARRHPEGTIATARGPRGPRARGGQGGHHRASRGRRKNWRPRGQLTPGPRRCGADRRAEKTLPGGVHPCWPEPETGSKAGPAVRAG